MTIFTIKEMGVAKERNRKKRRGGGVCLLPVSFPWASRSGKVSLDMQRFTHLSAGSLKLLALLTHLPEQPATVSH